MQPKKLFTFATQAVNIDVTFHRKQMERPPDKRIYKQKSI